MGKYIEMEKFALNIRKETLKMLLNRGFGHLGGAMSIVETLAVLYTKMKVDPKNPKCADRDYLVLSKGHAGPALYSTLALKGFFDLEVLNTLNNNGTILPSHPDRNLTPGVDMTTGSLGQGVSSAVGIALGLLRDKSPRKVYSIVGDGELNEGQCWEAVQFAAHNKLNNFVLFADNNKKQLDGTTDEICRTFDLVKKFESFGFDTVRVNGASVEEIDKALEKQKDMPLCIVLDTVKGQGVKYFEELKANHHIRFNAEQKEILKKEIAKLEEEAE